MKAHSINFLLVRPLHWTADNILSWAHALLGMQLQKAQPCSLTSICAVQTMVSDPDAVLLKLQNDFNDGKPIEVLTEGVREAIIKNVKRRMTPQPLKIRADVELTCFSYDGVLHIQVGLLSLTSGCKTSLS